uniref:OVATE domain-containing protein n=1 Tax=Opuntia streptacantha TaxID=393608 RepID=A0A7C9A5K7_OPUST
MRLRNSISNTKKFIQRTIDGFKSLLSKGNMYERLPKAPPFHPFSCGRDATDGDTETGYKDLDNFYSEFTHQWDSNKTRVRNKGQKKPFFTRTQKAQEFYNADTSQKTASVGITRTEEFCPENHAEGREFLKTKRPNYVMSQGRKQSPDLCSRSVRERRLYLVAEKLKELDLMAEGSADHNMDAAEILHYYSRLTCPAYLDIVDKFFTEMCAEFFSSEASQTVYSTPKLS